MDADSRLRSRLQRENALLDAAKNAEGNGAADAAEILWIPIRLACGSLRAGFPCAALRSE